MKHEDVLLQICVGDDAEAEEAFSWLFHNSWEEVFRVLRRRECVRGLNLADKEGAVIMAFQDFWTQARAGKINDMEKDPRALLHVIALRRATDLVRKNTTQKRNLSPEKIDILVNEAVQASSFASQLRLMERSGLVEEIKADFLLWLKEQKGVRLRTAQAMAEFFPDIATPKELFDFLCEGSNPPPTYESVKKARTDVLEKFKASIESKYQNMLKS